MAAVALGSLGNGFAVGNARRAGVQLHLVLLLHAGQLGAQVHVTQAADHRLVGVRVALDLEAGVFQFELVQYFKQAVFIALALGLHRQPLHGQWKLQRLQVDVVFVVRVVQHAIEFDLVHLGHRPDVARPQAGHFDIVLALQAVEVRHLERPLARADEQLRVLCNRALVHAKHPHLANERVHHHLEHMGQHVQRRIRLRRKCLRLCAGLAAVKRWRVALGRIGGQLGQRIQQLWHTRAGLGRDKQNRNQVPGT